MRSFWRNPFRFAFVALTLRNGQRFDEATNEYNPPPVAASSSLTFLALLPMLNAMGATSDAGAVRAAVNTLLASTSAATVCAAFAAAFHAFRSKCIVYPSVLVHCMCAAGGVAASSVASLMLTPIGAVSIGVIAGGLAILGATFTCCSRVKSVWLPKTAEFWAHAVPAAIGAAASAVLAIMAGDEEGVILYHMALYPIYPARVPIKDGGILSNVLGHYPVLADRGKGRNAGDQALSQGNAAALTLAVAFCGGLLAGLAARMSGKCGNRFSSQMWPTSLSFGPGCEHGDQYPPRRHHDDREDEE